MLSSEFYKQYAVPEKEWIVHPRNIFFVVPKKDYAISSTLAEFGLSKFEATITWPKAGLPILDEIMFFQPSIVVQLGEQVSRRYPFLGEGVSPDSLLKSRVLSAVSDTFVNLHHHDEFSMKDGLGTAWHLAELLSAQKRSFMCVTNHGSVGGWIKQYNACRAFGLKCIFGMEAYTSDYRGDDLEMRKKHRSANHLILVAKTKEGFDNIIKINNDAQLNGFYYTARANRESFSKWGKGIIATSACSSGEIPCALMADDWAKAEEVCRFYMSVFDKFYLELQIIEAEMQREVNRRIIQLAQKLGVEMVLACDSHYLDPAHTETHSLMMHIKYGKPITEKLDESDDAWDFAVGNLYYRNATQMEDVFRNGFTEKGGIKRNGFLDDVFTEEVFFRAMANTRMTAIEVDEILLDSKVKLPKLYPDSKQMLREKINAGFRARCLNVAPNKQEYIDRLRYEFEIIDRLGWNDYFLICERIVNDAIRDFGEWSVGYGRGSGAGSLVSYCLRITDCDPIRHGLLFERFLDEGRPDPPDMDLDFDPRYRDQIKENIVKVFGIDNTCSIGTYQTYKTAAVIVDVARALGIDIHEVYEVTKKLRGLGGVENDDGEEENINTASFDDLCKGSPELKAFFDAHPEVVFHAGVLRNQVKNLSMHAGGMIISDLNLKDRIPVFAGGEGQVISAWTESGSSTELSSVGLVKFDILGLSNLTIISETVALIEQTRGVSLRRHEIPIDDQESIKFGSKRDLMGIFQLENPDTKPVADAVEMESLEDVSAVTSLIRPGPRDMGMDMEYARRKHGEPYDMPQFMKEALKSTYGILVYQEQAMKISQVLCGFTPVESNKLRKAIGKKKADLMAEMKEKFIKGAQNRIDAGQITEKEVEAVWSNIESFAGYGFNKSHAITYSAISCVEMWLKYNYPAEYMTSILRQSRVGIKKYGSSEEAIAEYINYCRKNGIDVLGPNVNRSREQFSTDGQIILFSLGHIKNVASSASVVVSHQPYKDMADFCERAIADTVNKKGEAKTRKLNKKVVESLIAAGAFDCFGTRNEMMLQYYSIRGEKPETIEQSTDREWQEKELELTGICLSDVPVRKKFEDLVNKNHWCLIEDAPAKNRTRVFGRIVSITAKTSKKGNQMYVVRLTDGLDSMNFFVFGGAMVKFRDEVKVGYVAAIPLKKFEGSNTRFYDVDRECEIVEK